MNPVLRILNSFSPILCLMSFLFPGQYNPVEDPRAVVQSEKRCSIYSARACVDMHGMGQCRAFFILIKTRIQITTGCRKN